MDENLETKKKASFLNFPTMRWGENDTRTFAKLYIKNECLWNYEHPDYRMKHKRLHACREIIAEFYDSTGIKLNEMEVKIKIKNLRSTYSQELGKIKTRSSAGVDYKPNLKWFYDFHKYLSQLKKDGDEIYDGDDVNQSFSTPEEEIEGCQEIWAAPSTHLMDSSDPFPNEEDYKLLDLKPELNESHLKHEGSSFKIKKKKIKRRHPSTDDSDRTFRGSLDSSSESIKEDEFDIYGKYIATQLRKMNLQKALRVQLEIQSLVSEARISGIADDK